MDVVSYAMGEGAGYSKGYSAGYDDGLNTGAYQEGYDAGEAAGYASGYDAGYGNGYDAGYTNGYYDGEAAGYATGYDTGYTEGAASITPSAKKLLAARNGSHLFAPRIYGSGNSQFSTGVAVLADGVLKSAINYDDFEDCDNIYGLFRGQYLTTEFPTFNTSNVKSAGYAFADCFTDVIGTAPYLDLSSAINITGMFAFEHAYGDNMRSRLKTIPLYNFTSVTTLTNLFKNCGSLESIPALNFSSIPGNSPAFVHSGSNGWIYGCYSLKEINILDIHYNFYISASTQFTREALVHIIGNLRDMTGSTAKTLTMGSTNMTKLTDEDIAVATGKNWTIA